MIEIEGYKIIKELGRGGMATVYLAKDKGLDREVALKVLTIQEADPAFQDSFITEGRTIAKLEHRHIIKINRINVANNIFYMEMELLSTGTLRDRLNKDQRSKSRLSFPEIVRIIEQISSALSYAHEKGYIHRDVKPANILFRDNGEAVLADFGIAKYEEIESDFTRAGYGGIGTVNYMPPEQAMGDKIDGRTDLYSLGIVLYEMLTGKLPFKAKHTMAIMHKHANEKIPQLPAEYHYLQPVVDKATAKTKEERYSSAIDFSNALKATHENNQADNTVPVGDIGDTCVYTAPPSQQAQQSQGTAPYIQQPQNQSTAPYTQQPQNQSTAPYTQQPQNQSTAPYTQQPQNTGSYRQTNITKPWRIPNQNSSEQLVISFIDISNSTNISEKMGDFAYETIRKTFEEIVAASAMNLDQAALVKMMGDGALIIYSDSVYAIENSIKIQRNVRAYSRHNKATKFSLRIGLHFGEVTLETGDVTPLEAALKIDVHGAHVNKAARIEGCCPPNLVAMSYSVYDIAYPRLQHNVDLYWKDAGEKKLKGIKHKEKIHLVSSEKIAGGNGNGNGWIKYLFLFIVIISLAGGVLFFLMPLGGQNLSLSKKVPVEKVEAGKAVTDNSEVDKVAADKIAAAKAAADQAAADQAAADQAAADQAVADQAAADQAAADQAAADQAVADQAAADQAAADQAAADQAAADNSTRNITKKQLMAMLDLAFRSWETLCGDYKTYRNHETILQANVPVNEGSSQSRRRMKLEKKKDKAEENVIESFNTFKTALSEIKDVATMDNELADYMVNKKLSRLEKKRFTKAINDEMSADKDDVRGDKINYYKTICKKF